VSRLMVSLLALNVLGALIVGWMIVQRARGPKCPIFRTPGCPLEVELSALGGGVRYGAAKPRFRVYLFVDLASGAARQAYQELTLALVDKRLAAEIELRVLHAPEGGCPPGEGSYSCAAAAVVECAESIAPGVGLEVVGDAFDVGWGRGEKTSALLEFAQRRVSGAKEGPAASVAACVESVRAVHEQIASHAEVASKMGVLGVGGVVEFVDDPPRRVSFGDWLTRATLLRLMTCVQENRCEGGEE